MPSTPNDRPTHAKQDIRELFARSGKRPTRRFDEIVDAVENQHAHATDIEATTEADDATLERQAKANQAELSHPAVANAVAEDEAYLDIELGRSEAQLDSGAGDRPSQEVPLSAGHHPPVWAPVGSVISRPVAAIRRRLLRRPRTGTDPPAVMWLKRRGRGGRGRSPDLPCQATTRWCFGGRKVQC